MLEIEAVNHVGIRIHDRVQSIEFYEQLGFLLQKDAGFEAGHPLILRHPSGVILNLLGPSDASSFNILMDVPEKHPGITHFALTITSVKAARGFLEAAGIEVTGSFEFEGMSAIFIRDPDRNVIELDSYDGTEVRSKDGYSAHPS
jgi:lactoylglutathione lyase